MVEGSRRVGSMTIRLRFFGAHLECQSYCRCSFAIKNGRSVRNSYSRNSVRKPKQTEFPSPTVHRAGPSGRAI